MRYKVTIKYGTYNEFDLHDIDGEELTELLAFMTAHADVKSFEVVAEAVPVDPVQPTEEDDF